MNKQLGFPSQYRLLSKADFKAVFDQCDKVNQKQFLALFKPNQMSHARLGIVIAKRTVNSAVARNRIRRVIRESFRLNREQLKGFDIIVLVRQNCDTLDKANLREGIDKLWEKLRIFYQKRSP